MRVGYLGPTGTFSEQAMQQSLAVTVLDAPVEPVALATVHEVVCAVESGLVDRAIAPIENSVEGGINEVIDALVHDAPEVKIVGEYVLEIDHCLIAREAIELSDVISVCSHPQALAQCASSLRREVPSAELRPTSSTAEAVQVVMTSDQPIAALASKLAAKQSGAVVLAESVADHQLLSTRFIWLSREASAAPQEGEAGKSAILFSGAGDGSPGWLLDCLSEFASRSINLTRIESRPARLELGLYIFLIDVEGRVDLPGPAADALAGLAQHCQSVRVLGSYPVE
jgi:prephenate dehydratase